MPIVARQIHGQVSFGGVVLDDWLSLRCSHSAGQGYSRAQVVVPVQHGDYDDEVEILMGATPGNGPAPRFRGYRRNPNFDYYPRAVTYDCIGRLGKAAEYFNGEDPNFLGGLAIFDLLGTAMGATSTAGPIISAVLTRAGVPHDPANIGDSGRLYGTYWTQFIWRSGTPTGTELADNPFIFRRAGQAALDYIHQYDQIDAIWDGDASGGFYRTLESLGGEVFRVVIGGRPSGSIDQDPSTGEDIVFDEGGSSLTGAPFRCNILSSRMQREFPRGNRCLVIGLDPGQAIQGAGVAGPYHFEALGSNAWMPADSFHYDSSPPSSPMIEFDTIANATSFGFGQDCQTVAEARLLEVNRETVSGQVETAEDYLIGPAQTHLYRGPGGQADRGGTGEPLWCQGVDYELTKSSNGAPIFRATVTFLGGGGTDAMLESLPTAA